MDSSDKLSVSDTREEIENAKVKTVSSIWSIQNSFCCRKKYKELQVVLQIVRLVGSASNCKI